MLLEADADADARSKLAATFLRGDFREAFANPGQYLSLKKVSVRTYTIHRRKHQRDASVLSFLRDVREGLEWKLCPGRRGGKSSCERPHLFIRQQAKMECLPAALVPQLRPDKNNTSALHSANTLIERRHYCKIDSSCIIFDTPPEGCSSAADLASRVHAAGIQHTSSIFPRPVRNILRFEPLPYVF